MNLICDFNLISVINHYHYYIIRYDSKDDFISIDPHMTGEILSYELLCTSPASCQERAKRTRPSSRTILEDGREGGWGYDKITYRPRTLDMIQISLTQIGVSRENWKCLELSGCILEYLLWQDFDYRYANTCMKYFLFVINLVYTQELMRSCRSLSTNTWDSSYLLIIKWQKKCKKE